MLWYIVICFLMFYPTALLILGKKNASRKIFRMDVTHRTQKADYIALCTACIILAFFMACRGKNVGVDTKYYYEAFAYLQTVKFQDLFSTGIYVEPDKSWNLDFEAGYRLYNKLLGLFFQNPQAITICNSLLIVGLLYKWIKRESCNYMLSIWLYITLGIYQTEMNVARNAIAIFICYNALKYVKGHQLGHYVFMILIAASFHKSALLFIPLYFVFRRKTRFFSPISLILLSILLGEFFLQGAFFARNFMPGSMARYLKASNSLEAIVVGVFYAALVIFIWINLKPNEKAASMQGDSVGWCFLFLNLFSFTINTRIQYAARVAALFGPYIIVLVPNLLCHIEGKARRKQTQMLVIVGCGVQYILRMMINNIGGTMPYEFFW